MNAVGSGSWFSIVPVAEPSSIHAPEAFVSVSVSVSSPSSCEGKAASRVAQQVDYGPGHVRRIQLPVRVRGRPVAPELGVHRARKHAAHPDAVPADFLHQRLGQRVQARLGRAVRNAAGKRVLAGEAADVDVQPLPRRFITGTAARQQ